MVLDHLNIEALATVYENINIDFFRKMAQKFRVEYYDTKSFVYLFIFNCSAVIQISY